MNTEIIDRLKSIEKMLRTLLAKKAESPIAPPAPGTPELSPSTPPPWKSNEYMKPNDVAKEIGIDVSTVRRWLRGGEMPYTKFGRAVRIKTKDFEKYAKDNYIRAGGRGRS